MASFEGRTVDRKHVLLKAIIISDDGVLGARVGDLSESGVKISCANPPAEGRDVIFKHGDIFVAAHVTWVNKTHAGLEFYRKLAAGELINILHLTRIPPSA